MDESPDTGEGEVRDPMGPPAEVCECYCLHCGRVFMSDGMWLQRIKGGRDEFEGFWMCPTPNCSGAGFTIDIFPTDPAHPANDGWVDFDEDKWDDEDDENESAGDSGEPVDWDPEESKWRRLDEEYPRDEDYDIEGEEWKQGMLPEQTPSEPEWAEQARREREEEEKRYDEPDRRPREIDWSERNPPNDGGFNEKDIPF